MSYAKRRRFTTVPVTTRIGSVIDSFRQQYHKAHEKNVCTCLITASVCPSPVMLESKGQQHCASVARFRTAPSCGSSGLGSITTLRTSLGLDIYRRCSQLLESAMQLTTLSSLRVSLMVEADWVYNMLWSFTRARRWVRCARVHSTASTGLPVN